MCLALQSTCNFKPVPLSTVKYVVVEVGRIPFLKSLWEIRLMNNPQVGVEGLEFLYI